jgi:choline-sulfatase
VSLWTRERARVVRVPGFSVLLITIDTLRADAIGCYGNPRGTTPWMDRLAAAGVRFEDVHAHNVVTLASHANILSGRYPTEHGVRDNAGFRFPERLPTLATLLADNSYATGAFVSAFPLAARFGLTRGFQVYDDAFVGSGNRAAFLEQERSGASTVSRARRWLEAREGRPSFCWVHLYEPHFPYAPPEPWATRFRTEPYQGEVAAADAALGGLLEPLLDAGVKGRTLVVLTADHGESLGEHGERTHGILAYEATLRVPLILFAPRLLRPRVTRYPARHVDVLPTVLDALSLPIPEEVPGRTLLPAATGASAAPPDASYFEALSGALNRGWAPLHGAIRAGAKYIELPIPELYDLGSDPRETRNLAASQPSRIEAMRGLLDGLRSTEIGISRSPEASDTLARLRSLGYLASAASPRPGHTKADDPKNLMDVDAELQDVASLYLSGDLAEARTRCRSLVARRPGMLVSLLSLAQIERARGDLAAAVKALQEAVALNPEDATAVSLLGASLTEAGRAREAVDLLEPFAGRASPDTDVLTTRGLGLAKLGRFTEALAALARAHEVEPSNASVRVAAGTVHLMSGDRRRAREAFEEAVAQDPEAARAWSSLGVLAAQEGHQDEAMLAWRKALALDPGEGRKLFALAGSLWGAGHGAEARPYLECFVATAPPSSYAREIEQARRWLAVGAPPRG